MKVKLGDILVAIPIAIYILTCITNVNGVTFSGVTQETLSANPNQTFLGKYLETDYTFFEQPSSTQYLITTTNGGTVQTNYGTFTNTTVELVSDYMFVGKYEGYSMSSKHQAVASYYDVNEKCILVEHSLTLQSEGKSRTSLLRGEFGKYTDGYDSLNDITTGDIDDKWSYSYEERWYENGVYDETIVSKVEVTVKDFPTKIVQAGTFSTVHTEVIIWDNDRISTKVDEWLRIVDGKTIAKETYERNNEQWILSTTKELLSETDTQIVVSNPNESGQVFQPYLFILIGLTTLSLGIVFTFFGYKNLAKRRALRQQQENEGKQAHYYEEQRRREQERREQRDRERKDRERSEQEYARARKYAQINSTDPFEVLGIPRNASRQQIKDAFWMLSKEWHPDRFAKHSDPKVMQLANENYVRIKEAYETICRTKGWT